MKLEAKFWDERLNFLPGNNFVCGFAVCGVAGLRVCGFAGLADRASGFVFFTSRASGFVVSAGRASWVCGFGKQASGPI